MPGARAPVLRFVCLVNYLEMLIDILLIDYRRTNYQNNIPIKL